MRDLDTVITQLLQVIPIEEQELREALEAWLDTHNYSSAEDWNEIGDILYNYVFSDFYPEIGWQNQVERIWTGDDYADDLTYSNF